MALKGSEKSAVILDWILVGTSLGPTVYTMLKDLITSLTSDMTDEEINKKIEDAFLRVHLRNQQIQNS